MLRTLPAVMFLFMAFATLAACTTCSPELTITKRDFPNSEREGKCHYLGQYFIGGATFLFRRPCVKVTCDVENQKAIVIGCKKNGTLRQGSYPSCCPE
uniref:Putative 8.9 kDa family member n=1 Tax=Rhipicephalus pulchellus TaxID=72859 RepID=L7MCB6_RHIPC